jgi:hypothetical protein
MIPSVRAAYTKSYGEDPCGPAIEACSCLLEAACAAWQPGRGEEREQVDGCISAIGLLGREGGLEHARALVRLALLDCADGRIDEAERLCAQVDAIRVLHDDRGLAVHAARLRSWIAHARGNLATMAVCATEAARLASERGSVDLTAASLLDAGFAHRRLGRHLDAKRVLRVALRIARERELPSIEAWALVELGIAVARGGADLRGVFLIQCAIDAFAALGDRPAGAAAFLRAAELALDMGDVYRAKSRTNAALELLDGEHAQLRCRALAIEAAIHARHGRRDLACELARLAVVNLDETALGADGEAKIRLIYAEVLHANRRHEEARRAVRAARERLVADARRVMSPRLTLSFLADVPEHARILELAERWNA